MPMHSNLLEDGGGFDRIGTRRDRLSPDENASSSGQQTVAHQTHVRGRTRSGTTTGLIVGSSGTHTTTANEAPVLPTSRTIGSGLGREIVNGFPTFFSNALTTGTTTPTSGTTTPRVSSGGGSGSRSGQRSHRRVPSEGLGLKIAIPDPNTMLAEHGNANLAGSAGRFVGVLSGGGGSGGPGGSHSSGGGGVIAVPLTAIGSAFPTDGPESVFSERIGRLPGMTPSTTTTSDRNAPPSSEAIINAANTSSLAKLLVHGSSRNDEGRTAFYGNEAIVMIDKIPWAEPGDLVSVRNIASGGGIGQKRRAAGSGEKDAAVGTEDGPTSSRTGEAASAPSGRSRRTLRGDYLFHVSDPEKIHKNFTTTNIRGTKPHLSQTINNTPQSTNPNISVSEAVSALFGLRHRTEVTISKVLDPTTVEADHVELLFSGQYLGRQDMWRLGMALEGRCLYAGQKVEFAGSVRAEVKAIWIRGKKRASGLATSRTKTIFRSKSAQFYLFIHVCRETYEFDEDGERNYERALHGFLPELFHRWKDTQANHVVTIILFGRVFYDEVDMETLDKLGEAGRYGLMRDERKGFYKDFYQVVVDFETRNEWQSVMPELKRTLGATLQDILLEHHLQEDEAAEAKIAGRLSFAFEGNVLESINLVLNPFSESYIDRDLSRTGLCVTIITPGTGHFAVDKQLLRMTSERMIDHGVCLDLVCLSQIPLHATPLFSYWSEPPEVAGVQASSNKVNMESGKPIDPLYVDAKLRDMSKEIVCYCMPYWVDVSYYSRSHDRPLRPDRFVPRCKMYEVQMMGIIDHDLTTLALPMLPEHDAQILGNDAEARLQRQDRYDRFDDATFSGPAGSFTVAPVNTSRPQSIAKVGLSQPSSFESSKGYQSSATHSYRAAMLRQQDVTPAVIQESPGKIGLKVDIQRPRGMSLISASSDRRGKFEDVSAPTAAQKSESEPTELLVPLRSPRQQTQPPRQTMSRTSTISARTSGGTSSSDAQTPKLLRTKPSQGSIGFGAGAAKFLGKWMTRAIPSQATAAVDNVAGNNSPSPKTTANQALLAAKNQAARTPSPRSPSTASTSSRARLLRPEGSGLQKRAHSPAVSAIMTEPVSIPVRGKSIEDKPAHRANKELVSDVEPRPGLASTKRARSDLREERRVPGRPVRRADTLARSFPGQDATLFRPSLADNRKTQDRVVYINPLRPLERHGDPFGQSRRWQHSQTKPSFQHDIQWDSMCAPACLPLTNDLVPTLSELQTEYQEQLYPLDSHANQLSFLLRSDTPSQELAIAVMREMASQRLSQNFQFITIPHGLTNGPPVKGKVGGVMPGGASDVLRAARGPLYLSASNQIHRLDFALENRNTLEVHNYTRIINYSMDSCEYKCLVWPRHRSAYQPASAVFRYPTRHNDFNYLDRLIIGAEDELTDSVRYWRTRFILIPSDKPALRENSLPGGDTLKAEENQIYGAQKVLELVARLRWRKSGDVAGPQPKLLMTWLAPSACVADTRLMGELDTYHKGMDSAIKKKSHLVSVADAGPDGAAQASAVAAAMRDPANGLTISDRRWHHSIYYDSFVGDAFVTWLLAHYGDIETREQATELGNNLMKHGVIEHSRGEHTFMDGYYFYRLTAEYGNRSSRRKKAFDWFTKGFLGEDAHASADLIGMPTKVAINAPTTVPNVDAGVSAKPLKIGRKRKIRMSQTMVLDLDERHKSDRAEVAILHSDIIHNPANALHFELNWIGVTAGLLDEVRQKWSREADKWGLRLVEAPVEQILDVGKKCAYRACVPIKLAVAPPAIVDLDQRLPEAIRTTNFFEYALLTDKFDFVLDVEASSRYPDDVQVEYSYRKAAVFEYSQFIHKSGVALVQCIGGIEGFIWSDNRLFFGSSSRSRLEHHTGKTAGQTNQEAADALRRSMEAFCSDAIGLTAFYESKIPPLLADAAGQAEVEGAEQAVVALEVRQSEGTLTMTSPEQGQFREMTDP